MQKRKPFRVIQGKKKKKRTGEKLVYTLLGIAVGLLVLQALWSLVRDVVAAAFVNTIVSEEGVLEQTLASDGILVREERVVGAPLTGTLQWLVEEGKRLAVNTPVAAITAAGGARQNVTTPGPGVVVLQLDGLEGILQPGTLDEINVPQMKETQAKAKHTANGSDVQQGSLLFKVVDNFTWYYVAEFAKEDFALLEGKTTALMRFSFATGEEVKGSVILLAADEKKVTAAFKVEEDVDGCFRERFAKAEIITKRTRGVVLPASALLMRGEETGIYILDNSVVRYRTVDVLEAGSGQVVVGGLRTGLSVITNPVLVQEDQRL